MRRRCVRSFLLALVFFACGKDANSPSPVPPPPPVSRIEVGPFKPSIIVGEHIQFTTLITGANGDTVRGREVTWSSSDPVKVSISSTGLATGLGLADGVVITAHSGGVNGTMQLKVVIDISGEWNFTEHATWPLSSETASCEHTGSFKISRGPYYDFIGKTAGVMTCTAPLSSSDLTDLPWPGTLSQFELTTSRIQFNYGGCAYDGAIADPQLPAPNGTVACASGYSGTWQASRGGAPLTALSVRGALATVVGGWTQLIAVPTDAAGHVLQRTVTWSSDNPSVAGISATGLVTARAAGSAHITAQSEGRTSTVTVTVDAVSFSAASVGHWHSCALTAAGKAYCWGWGGDGQLGTGARALSLAPYETAFSPEAVSGDHFFAQITTGLVGHSCAITNNNEAYCWGDNAWGQLGDGSTVSRFAPTHLSGSEQYASIAVGWRHTCGLTTAGTAYCWGDNEFGQLGTGTTLNSATPVAVAGGLEFRALSAGARHTCGLAVDDRAYCWGANGDGRLGDGSTTMRLTPVAVTGDHAFAVVAAGGSLSCGITVDGPAFCWGGNSAGGLGNGTTTNSATPVPVSGGHTFATSTGSLATGEDHACAVATGGAAYCWGFNALGQLGDGSSISRTAPVAVLGGISFAALSTGGWHTCGATASNVTWCWGLNANGQVGASAHNLCSIYSCSLLPLMVLGQPGASGPVAPISTSRTKSPHALSSQDVLLSRVSPRYLH